MTGVWLVLETKLTPAGCPEMCLAQAPQSMSLEKSKARTPVWVIMLQEKGFSSHHSYSLSKLASQFFTKDLADRVKSRGITANCLDPGTVNTKMLYAGWGPCGISIKVALP